MKILDIINQIAATSKRTEKEAILKANANNKLLKAVFKAAYDPTINYFIKKIPAYASNGLDMPLDESLRHLSMFSARLVTGNEAIQKLSALLDMSEEPEIISRIIQRDLKCGATGSTANKVWKGLIPEFSYMRCSLPKDVKLDKWDWKSGIYSQMKADAMFVNCDIIDDNEILFTSRNGTQIPCDKLTNLVSNISESYPVGNRLNGELCIDRDGVLLPREISNGIVNSLVKGEGELAPNEKAIYIVWDIIPLEFVVPGGKCDIEYDVRYGLLKSCHEKSSSNDVRLIETRIVYSLDEAYEHYFDYASRGLEGTIIKTRSGKWADHTSKDQVKLKVDCDVDLEILGFTEGKGKNTELFGSVICGSSDRLLIVNVSGFTEKEREAIHKTREEKLGKIMTVKFNNIMYPSENNPLHSLFLPRYVEIRDDKSVADDLQRVIDQFEAAIGRRK